MWKNNCAFQNFQLKNKGAFHINLISKKIDASVICGQFCFFFKMENASKLIPTQLLIIPSQNIFPTLRLRTANLFKPL